MIPVYLVCYAFLPHTWTGNVIQAGIFVVAVGILFLLLPSFVGEKYKNEVYPKITDFINAKILKRK